MPSLKDEISKRIIQFFNTLGIDPLLPMILVMLLIGITKIKHIKSWSELKPNEKRWDILNLIFLMMLILGYIIKTIRGY